MKRRANKDVSPTYVAQRLRQQYGDGALKALHDMTFSAERRGAAERKALFHEVAEILTKGTSAKQGGVFDVSA